MSLPTIKHVRIDHRRIVFELNDDREVSLPIEMSSRLAGATEAERERWTIGARGQFISWPAIDEDIAIWEILGIDEQSYLSSLRDAPVS